MLIALDKSMNEETLSQPLQNNDEQFKPTVTLLNGYNGILSVTHKNKNYISQHQLLINMVSSK